GRLPYGPGLAFLALLLGLTAGCSGKPDPGPSGGGSEEEKVRETFAALQGALKAGDADKVWDLLDPDSRADAERAAGAVKSAYEKADAGEKAEKEKNLGLAAAELSALTGKGYLKTKRFLGSHDEIPGSKVQKVTVKGDNATLIFLEPDGDTPTLKLVRQEGR